MSAHKASAARCHLEHQAWSRQPAIRALPQTPLRGLALSVLLTWSTTILVFLSVLFNWFPFHLIPDIPVCLLFLSVPQRLFRLCHYFYRPQRRGGVCSRGVSDPGVPGPEGGLLPGGGIPACTEADPPLGRDGYYCGRYASYWNAFLLCWMFRGNWYSPDTKRFCARPHPHDTLLIHRRNIRNVQTQVKIQQQPLFVSILRSLTELFLSRKRIWTANIRISYTRAKGVFEIPQVPFAFEFVWIKSIKRPNGNSETKQSLNYNLAIQLTFPNLMNGDLATVLWLNCHSAIQTQTQTQTEPGAYRMHSKGVKNQKRLWISE